MNQPKTFGRDARIRLNRPRRAIDRRSRHEDSRIFAAHTRSTCAATLGDLGINLKQWKALRCLISALRLALLVLLKVSALIAVDAEALRHSVSIVSSVIEAIALATTSLVAGGGVTDLEGATIKFDA